MQATRYDQISNRRAIIDRPALVERARQTMEATAPAERRAALTELLKAALADGRAEIGRRILARPRRGMEYAASTTFLTDQILLVTYWAATGWLYPLDNPTAAERIALVATGGYGRATMAPFSDVDLMFLAPMRHTPWIEQIVETILYILWDLGLKVGYATRTVDDVIRLAKQDLTIETAVLEARYLCGDEALFRQCRTRFGREVQAGDNGKFLAEKIAERDARHLHMGESRYVVEPHIKEGKGGLRDLQTLFWIGKFTMHARDPHELVGKGLFTASEYYQFQRALSFLWTVRIHLHMLSGRAMERLTFDVQPALAKRLEYRDRPGESAVEQFMCHYFLTAKHVGSLTGLFLAHLEEQARHRKWIWPQPRTRRIRRFRVTGDRLEAPDDHFFEDDPLRLIEMFEISGGGGLAIHPLTLRQATRDARLVTRSVREDPRANRLFLRILTQSGDPEATLRAMIDTGIMGRFLPDFGQIVAKPQFDMYHHYTVDEHTIRAIGLMAKMERGSAPDAYRQAAAILQQVKSRRALYVATLLHDIAKGRPGNHSIVGEKLARILGPRLGLDAAETENVAWLVRWHLLMSATAFKRDIADPATTREFCLRVTNIERLRALFVLTTVDISAVGPGVFTAWKGQLLSALFNSAEEVLRLGHKQVGRSARVAERKAELLAQTGMDTDVGDLTARFPDYAEHFQDSYWLAEPMDVLRANLALVLERERCPEGERSSVLIRTRPDAGLKTTLVTVLATDTAGLFYRIAGGIALAGASIVGARIHTSRNGMALDNIIIEDPAGGPFSDPARLERLKKMVEAAVAGDIDPVSRLRKRTRSYRQQENFHVVPEVLIDNQTSRRYTILEVVALDRPALLFGLARALYKANVVIHSAHISTYGERAVDTFYLTALSGSRIQSASKLRMLERRVMQVARTERGREAA